MRISKHRMMEGYELKWWQGIAWYYPDVAECIVLPIPLNIIYRAVKRAWLWLKLPAPILTDTTAYLIAENKKLADKVSALEAENRQLRKGFK
jgi:hypothetical protein